MLVIEAANESRRLCDKLSRGEIMTKGENSFVAEQLQSAIDPEILSNVFFCCRKIRDFSHVPLIEPHLSSKDVGTASMALWTLCWLGQAERFKPYILEAVEKGFAWDPRREVGEYALAGAGLHLRTHRDRDFAQLLLRWTPPEDMDGPYDREPPTGMNRIQLTFFLQSAGEAMGAAVGADPKALIEDHALFAACVKRFVAERQDG